MTDITTDLLSALPIDDLADQLGVTPSEVGDALSKAAPALLSGLTANAQGSQDGAASLFGAIAQGHDSSLLDADDLLGAVDTDDGSKIVAHTFGSNTDAVTHRLARSPGEESLISRLLPMIAPFVMAWLSKKLGSAVGGSENTGGLGEALGGGDSGQGGLGGLLGGLLGGGGDSSGGGLGDLLGGLVGGGGSAGQPDLGGLTDILGGLAGGGGGGGAMPDLSDLLGSG